MKHVIVSVRDAKSEVFGRPFFAQTEGAAIRAFDDEVNRPDPENVLNRHPQDFQLFKLGEFDDQEGSFVSIVPKLLIMGDEVRKLHAKISKV